MSANVEGLDTILQNQRCNIVQIDAEAIAAASLAGLVELTQTDQTERGLVVGIKAGSFIRSQILEGRPAEIDDETGRFISGSWSPPILPFGIKGVLASIKKASVIHTHPMPPAIDHLRTTPISDKDIRAFLPSKYIAMVMADRGGIHMLARHRSTTILDYPPGASVVGDATEITINEGGGSIDVIRRVAHQLSLYGLTYLYTPELVQEQKTVGFQNMRYLSSASELSSPKI